MSASTTPNLRHDWSLAEVKALFQQPFNDLLFQAQTVPPCFRSKPAPAPKTVSTARNPATTTPAWISRN